MANQVCVHTRLSRAYLALARLSCFSYSTSAYSALGVLAIMHILLTYLQKFSHVPIFSWKWKRIFWQQADNDIGWMDGWMECGLWRRGWEEGVGDTGLEGVVLRA